MVACQAVWSKAWHAVWPKEEALMILQHSLVPVLHLKRRTLEESHWLAVWPATGLPLQQLYSECSALALLVPVGDLSPPSCGLAALLCSYPIAASLESQGAALRGRVRRHAVWSVWLGQHVLPVAGKVG